MSTEAIIMMLVAISVVWGGLLLSIFNLTRADRAAGKHRDL